MSNILITADIHLKKDDNRSEVLQWVCGQVRDREIELVMVAGDLFDSTTVARKRNTEIRNLIHDQTPENTEWIMIPGNHDENLSELSWGPSVTVLEAGDVKPYEFENGNKLLVHGLPYLRGQSFLQSESMFNNNKSGFHLLLSHASYLTEHHQHLLDKILDHSEENAFILDENDFSGSFFDLILLGHWHDYQFLEGSPPAHYVGSPVPNGKHETGPKSILLGELSNAQLNLETLPVDSPPGWFNERLEMTVLPGFEDRFFEKLGDRISEQKSGCVLYVKIDGYTEWSEEKFRRKINKISDKFESNYREIHPNVNIQSARSFDFPLVKRLLKNMESEDVTDYITLDDLNLGDEPSLVFKTANDLMQESGSQIENRAKELLMGSLLEVLEE